METLEEKKLTITRTFDAPRALVWDAWTEQKHIKEWWGPKRFTNPVCEWDAKKGGQINIHMKGPDGTIYPMDGIFIEIEKPEKIVFNGGALDGAGKRLFDQITSVSFMEEGKKTKVVIDLHFKNILPEAMVNIGGANEGWNMSLDKLETLLLKLK